MAEIQFDGIHYETGSVRNLLALQGVRMPHTQAPPSEGLLLGLSGGITFGYFSFAYQGYDPFVALLTRNTFDPLEQLFDRLGASRTVRQTTNPAKAEQNLAEALAVGQPVLVWADRFSLPYCPDEGLLGEGMYEMIPMVVFGYDAGGGVVQIADQSRRPLQVSAASLAQARGRVKKERFRQVTLSLPSFDKLAQGVAAGLRACYQSFHTSPVKGHAGNFGLAAYRRWAGVLVGDQDKQRWSKVFPPGRALFSALTSAFERIELFGTGGAASRPLYADFLEEAGLILGQPDLSAAAAQFRALGLLWTDLGRALLPDEQPLFKEARLLLLQKRDLFWEHGQAAVAEIAQINARLRAIRSAMETDFPLSPAEATALKHGLHEHVLRLHDAEKVALDLINVSSD